MHCLIALWSDLRLETANGNLGARNSQFASAASAGALVAKGAILDGAQFIK